MPATDQTYMDISEVTKAFEQLDKRLRKKIDGKRVLKRWFARWVKRVMGAWNIGLRTGGDFRGVHWAPVQEKYKRAIEGGGDVLLWLTGGMRNSVVSEPISVNDKRLIAGPHGGGVDEVKAVRHNEDRPFVFVTNDDADDLKDEYLREVDRQLTEWSHER